MKRSIVFTALAGFALICTLTAAGINVVGGSRYAPLIGPCADRKGPTEVYYKLALSMVYERISSFDGEARTATPESVGRMKAEIARLRQEWVPTLPDTCLAAHAQDWLSSYEQGASRKLAEKERLGDFASDYDRRRAIEKDQERALAERLGVRP